MPHIHGFPPIADPSPRVLILGTMPGKASLRANRYYAHPRNSFWPIMGEVLGFDPTIPYEERAEILRWRGIALWDVLQLCTRESSLDSDIDESSVVANDFAGFYAGHPDIRRVCFNGAKAADLYRRHVLPTLDARWAGLDALRLPSTSPANAGVPYVEKVRVWKRALDDLTPDQVSIGTAADRRRTPPHPPRGRSRQ
jgi:TDG/mug DNA glycosylase family protein